MNNLRENKFTNPFDRIRASYYIKGKKLGWSKEQINKAIDDKMAQLYAQKDINHDESKKRNEEGITCVYDKITDLNANTDFSEVTPDLYTNASFYGDGDDDETFYVPTQNYNNESQIRKGKIVLSESDIHKMVRECICKIIQEQHPKEYQLGKYKCIDGDWWDGVPHGLESKCCYIQDVRMYDSIEETIGLFRRCDNLKYFYAKIVPDKGKETKWQPMKLSEVPIVIRNDFSTINPSGHEPYLPF